MILRLERAHPDYRDAIAAILERLAIRHPTPARLTVRLYDPAEGDESLAHTEGAQMSLSARWFARPAAELAEAAQRRPALRIDGRDLPIHGPMTVEPDHVLTHEFWHAIAPTVPGSAEWTRAGWLAATADPATAFSAYSLADPDEWGAEAFAMRELGFHDDAELARLLGGR